CSDQAGRGVERGCELVALWTTRPRPSMSGALLPVVPTPRPRRELGTAEIGMGMIELRGRWRPRPEWNLYQETQDLRCLEDPSSFTVRRRLSTFEVRHRRQPIRMRSPRADQVGLEPAPILHRVLRRVD